MWMLAASQGSPEPLDYQNLIEPEELTGFFIL
jgi:hypothetical protein